VKDDVRTHRSKTDADLNFHANWIAYVTIVISRKDLSLFPGSEATYKGKKVRVRGEVKLTRPPE